MNKKEITAKLAANSKQSEGAVSAVLDALEELAIKMLQSKEKLVLPGFISIEAVARAARSGRNPQTGAVLQIPARTGVKVSAGTKLKKAVAK
ncbi:MAG: integration host factor [Candidatus Planktophila sp.]|jgi:DNA-binding protein HU-beta|nr:integration host factor [Candidatus Planktophila sp.]NQW74637.1 HU family DNA-binding protein [Candidatus Planktophila sp.]